jgi:hypothetical protein
MHVGVWPAIHLLVRSFGLDRAWTRGGNPWAQLFGAPVADTREASP